MKLNPKDFWGIMDYSEAKRFLEKLDASIDFEDSDFMKGYWVLYNDSYEEEGRYDVVLSKRHNLLICVFRRTGEFFYKNLNRNPFGGWVGLGTLKKDLRKLSKKDLEKIVKEVLLHEAKS